MTMMMIMIMIDNDDDDGITTLKIKPKQTIVGAVIQSHATS